MTLLYVYALVDEAPQGDPGRGLAGEALRTVPADEVWAVVGEMDAAPVPSPDLLRAHDGTIRRIDALVPALLPCRFGQTSPDERSVVRALGRRGDLLKRNLVRVRGAVQMTLRVYGRAEAEGEGEREGDAGEQAEPTRPHLGPGARYLRNRRRPVPPELEDLRRSLGPSLREEKVERAARPPLLATLHHLIDADRTAGYRRDVEAGLSCVTRLHVGISGPWPAYAFADDAEDLARPEEGTT